MASRVARPRLPGRDPPVPEAVDVSGCSRARRVPTPDAPVRRSWICSTSATRVDRPGPPADTLKMSSDAHPRTVSASCRRGYPRRRRRHGLQAAVAPAGSTMADSDSVHPELVRRLHRPHGAGSPTRRGAYRVDEGNASVLCAYLVDPRRRGHRMGHEGANAEQRATF